MGITLSKIIQHRIKVYKMSESSGDDNEGNAWIPYSQRKEWLDVKPLEQNEGTEPVARIAYSDKCKNNL